MSGVPHFYLLHDEHEVTLSAVSMPYVGRASFLPRPPEAQYLCGFQDLFLHVFFRIF